MNAGVLPRKSNASQYKTSFFYLLFVEFFCFNNYPRCFIVFQYVTSYCATVQLVSMSSMCEPASSVVYVVLSCLVL